MPPPYLADLNTLLDKHKPGSMLAVGTPAAECLADYAARHEGTTLDQLSGSEVLPALKGRGRYAFCLVADTLEHMDKETAGQLIARLRDLHAERLYVVVPMGDAWPGHASHWELSDLIGYGMMLAASYDQDGKRLQLFEFDIHTYKDTPDWLNAKYWAHPERWDKDRW